MLDSKKVFDEPMLEVIVLTVEDIVTASNLDDWETETMPVP